jgi:hypothetical protein
MTEDKKWKSTEGAIPLQNVESISKMIESLRQIKSLMEAQVDSDRATIDQLREKLLKLKNGGVQ